MEVFSKIKSELDVKLSSYIFICITAFALGALLVATHYEWIIIRFPTKRAPVTKHTQSSTYRTQVTLHYWHHNKWQAEKTEILASDDTAKTVENLLNAWLTLLDEEEVLEKKVNIQTVLIGQQNQIMYISFDRNPLLKEAASFQKLQWIEGLCKTMRENGIKIKQVQFLVHHKPLNDYHLDFSNPWPISGLIQP